MNPRGMVVEVLRSTVWAEAEESTIEILGVYTLLSHLTPDPGGVFSTVPYLSLEGPAGSGKSTAGKIMAALADGYVSSDRTPASLFRLVDSCPGRLLVLDEGDAVLRGERRQAFNNLLLQGNDWTATVERVGGRVVRKFRIFGPKVIVSIPGIDLSALRRRVIPVRMEQAPLPFTSRRDDGAIQAAREEAAAWAREACTAVKAATERWRASTDESLFLSQSHRAAWAPMLAVAGAVGVDLSGPCRAHGEALEQQTELGLDDALRGLRQSLPEGPYRYADLRKLLHERYGARAALWSAEKIGWAARRLGWPVRRDGRSRYVEIRRGMRGVVEKVLHPFRGSTP